MGSHFKASSVNMKTFLLAFTLLMLALHGSKADKVTSCLQCTSITGVSEDSECIKGTAKGTPCGAEMDGCFVNVVHAEAAGVETTTWTRNCCAGDLCSADQTWCATNDCNTGDPRDSKSNGNALVPALTFLLATIAVMA